METTLVALTATAFVAGAIDAISGGGGLIVIPALLAGGVEPVSAIATSKLQSSFGSAGALATYSREGCVDLRGFAYAAACSFAGALGGAALLQWFKPTVVAAVVPLFLVAAAVFFAVSDLGQERPGDRPRPVPLGVCAMLIGAYDGFFGPGAGAFFVAALLALGRVRVIVAVAHAKYLNVMSNLAALAVFIRYGHVVWGLGLAMGGACLLGGQLGARLATRFGARIARPLLVTMSLALTLKLLAAPGHPLRRLLAPLLDVLPHA